MSDRRNRPRLRLDHFLDIYSSHQADPVGTLVDISEGGAQITFDQPIDCFQDYYFYLQPCVHQIQREQAIRLVSRWCCRSSTAFYDAGFVVTQWPTRLLQKFETILDPG